MIFRIVAALIVIGFAVCIGAWLFTRDRRYLGWAVNLLKALLVFGLAFFGLLMLERAVMVL